MSRLVYQKALSPENALMALKQTGDARLLAGGTHLLVEIKRGAPVQSVIDISHVDALRQIRQDDEGIEIGASVCLRQLAKLPVPLLESALRGVCVQNRNAATLGGEIATGNPELLAALVCLDARLLTLDEAGEHCDALQYKLSGEDRQIWGRSCLIRAVRIPAANLVGRAAFQRAARRQGSDAAQVCAAALAHLSGEGRIEHLRLVLGGEMVPAPIRVTEAEALSGVQAKAIPLEELTELIHARLRSSSPENLDYLTKALPALARRMLREIFYANPIRTEVE